MKEGISDLIFWYAFFFWWIVSKLDYLINQAIKNLTQRRRVTDDL